jgi:two-component system chemotaxis sensor kinase CheA
VRKRAGASQGGIDLSGFLKHIDEVLSEWPRQSEGPESMAVPSAARAEPGRVSVAMKQRLGIAATEVFLQSLAAPGSRRLRRAWETLASELAHLDVVALMPLVRRHANGTKDLATELGKEIDIVIEGDDLRVGAEVLDALHTALLHTLRNAVDHGVEPPDVRIARGKPRRGMVTIRAEADAEAIRLTIEDDGAGLDREAIKRRAVSLGLLRGEVAAAATDPELVDLVFAPGFSVRDAVSTTSGRGIGMDAVRATVERIRGTIAMQPREEGGLRVVLTVPQTCKTIDVHRLPTTRPDVVLAIPTTWTIRRVGEGDATDPLEMLELPGGEGIRSRVVIARDREEHLLYIGGAVSRATALRGCPTPPQEPVEIVTIGEETVILLRPESFFAPTSGR